jgi:cell division transport system permease protein
VPQGRLDLPLAHVTSGRMLPWLTGALVYAAVLTLAVAIMADQALLALGERAQLVTVTLPLSDDVDVGAALEVLYQDRSVIAAAPLSDEELRALMTPWLGETRVDELPLPAMIDVRLDPLAAPDPAALQQALSEAVPGAMLASAAALPDRAEQVAALVRDWSAGLLALTLAAALLAIGAITRLSLRSCRAAVGLLRCMGASPGYQAAQFERHALACGLRGGAVGFGLALLTVAALLYSSRHIARAAAIELGLRPLDWALLAAMAAISLLLAVAVVRATAHWQLQAAAELAFRAGSAYLQPPCRHEPSQAARPGPAHG